MHPEPPSTFSIDARFNGPPDSGNGGYVCGEMAKALARRQPSDPSLLETGVRVRLMKPPPLETELHFAPMAEGSLGLFADDAPLAQAWPEPIDFAIPKAVEIDAARRAEKAFRGFEEHVFPGCFVCGPERAVGDGLRIFPGPLEDDASIFAATWQPDPTLGDDTVDPSFVWAALDCPGCFSFPQPEGAILLLGELSAAMHAPLPIDEPATLLSWRIEHSGRKHTTGSAIYDRNGRCCGQARGIWIELAG